ncbi:MFS transporter [Shewanella schlegeliana]|uniref:MFS transporter n=1 Tax=Shewanella schlegeliana TaxID=190308 RepID=A0ABS1SXD0_9GAMM|nr:MFS transporter [Shewanella schlegeliana]MBL4912650.1 MFS transporter [Shewanella schlegeliana]MCL1109840.1 MFS transporter [Shewanella schlegeliana]GIU32776.1 cyanate transporter [Shewanella schlegeliana]
MTLPHPSRFASSAFLLLGVLFIAISLRSPITGVGPLLDAIRVELHLSPTQAGMLTTLPLLAFAFFSPIASKLGRKHGLEQALMLSLLFIVSGLVVRSLGSASALFIGTVIIGAGIAFANVLLPSLMKRDFPTKIATMTSMYVLMMGAGSAMSASLAIPLTDMAKLLSIEVIPSWAFSLASLVIFPLIAILLWLPQMRKHTAPSKDTQALDSHSYLWCNGSAWQITLFLALNSFLMYIFISWLPTILVDHGFSHREAGVIHGILQLFTAVPALVLIPFMNKFNDKRLLSFGLTLMALIGILGLILKPELAMVWGMLFGFGAGGGFIVALALISLRTSCAQQAATLSGMAQFLGYLLAATGPMIIGELHEQTASWQLPLIVCAICAVLWSVFALFAAKDQLIEPAAHNSNTTLEQNLS